MREMNDTRWFKVVSNANEQAFFESKFLTGEALITFEDIASEWPLWNSYERHEFISAYREKRILNEEDFQVYEFLMEHAHSRDKYYLYDRLKDLPDKKHTLDLLKKLINSMQLDKNDNLTDRVFYLSVMGPLHYFYETIGLIGDCDVVSFLKDRIAEMMEHPEFFKGDFFSDAIVYICIKALEALCRIEPSDDNMKLLEGFQNHPNVRIAFHKILKSLKDKDTKEGNGTTD